MPQRRFPPPATSPIYVTPQDKGAARQPKAAAVHIIKEAKGRPSQYTILGFCLVGVGWGRS